MKTKDLLTYVVRGMTHRKVRSFLTILGIVIGIGSVVIMIALAQGIQTGIEGRLNSLGSNYVIIIPGSLNLQSAFAFGPPKLKGILTTKDADAVQRVEGVAKTSRNVQLSFTKIEFKGHSASTTVVGVTPSTYKEFLTIGLEKGQFIDDGDASNAVIGHKIATDLFEDEIKIGSTLKIKEKTFRVSGILNEMGQGGPADNAIIIDERAARLIAGAAFEKTRVSSILALTDGKQPPSEVADKIKERLRALHKVKAGDEDFTILTAESIAQQVGQITGLLTLFLGGVAAISLAVGGVGIANSMFTSIVERTREIGILKSIGANEKDILKLFLIESAFIGLLGGVIGVILALLVSALLGVFGITSIISIGLVIFALAFSTGIGAVSGYYPAKNAAKLTPIQALRYE